jgi:hypothetical protein
MEKTNNPDKERPGKRAKRKYEPPRILSEGIFETTALACGKISGQSQRCNGNPKKS